jgi:uncharacterized protein (TIGR02594 family)
MTTGERLYAHAAKDLGLSEIPGPASHPRIRLAIDMAADWLDEDDSKTAWCGCIMGLWCFELDLGVPAARYRAASWLNWGMSVSLAQARKGDVVIFARKGGNHVALFDRKEGRNVYVLGGNQSNRVSVAPYSEALVLGVRRSV